MTDQARPASTAEPAPAASAERSAGQMLRELRESAGVDVALLASAMKVVPQKIEALENERFEQLPDITFARGLASAICRAFGADPAPVLQRMPAAAPGLRPPAQDLKQAFRRPEDGPQPVLAQALPKPLLIGVALLLLAAAVVYFLPTLPIQLGAPTSQGAPAENASQPPDQASALTSDTGLPVPAQDPEEAASAAQLAASVAEAPASAPASAASEAAAPDLLSFAATGETWVTVRDASGATLLNRALASGDSVGVNGTPPLAVTVGRKDAVTVTVRGQPFNHRNLSSTPVARFQVK